MERERRTVLLAMVTLLMYGLVSFLGNGPFAFFPVNEIVFLLIALYFSFFNFKSAQGSYVLLLLLGLLDLSNNFLFLSFFMDNEQLQAYYANDAVTYVRIMPPVIAAIEITRFYWLTKWKVLPFMFPFAVTSIIAGVLFGSLMFITLGLVLFSGTLYYAYRQNLEAVAIYSKSLFYLFFLFTFLKLTALLTMSLYDLKFG